VSAPKGLTNVSDTALWVAVYRAMETERADALFRDPFADRLAGERGREIVRSLPQGKQSAWPMIVRTRVFDDAILRRLAEGCDAVINLAAGLDTRPYRMELPRELVWVEADLPGMIEYKTGKLSGEEPRCRLERRAVDLADAAARRAFLDELAARFKKALVVTEGLLIYLDAEQVRGLAADLSARPSFRWWLLDYATPTLRDNFLKRWDKPLKEGNSQFKFFPENAEFFGPFGWRPAETRYMADEARRLGREMPMAWLWRLVARVMPAEKRERFRTMSGLALLANSTKDS
jgi:methyltransferase (TIGR00027 family)